jgi:Uma2 family endonuclease
MAPELNKDLVTSAPDASPLPRMTFEEFLEWTDEQTFAEWIDGEVILKSPVSLAHQTLVGFLAASLQFFVEANEGGIVLTAPFLIKLSFRPSGREPDVIFVSKSHLSERRASRPLDEC